MKQSALMSILFFLFFSTQVVAEEYATLEKPQPTNAKEGTIEVVEVFWYACPHCFDFEPELQAWLKEGQENITFRRMPGIFRKNWIPHAKAFFTAEALGIEEEMSKKIFKAIHLDKKNLHDDKAFKAFFVKNGVDAKKFDEVYNSKDVETKVKQSFLMGQRYRITGVPAVVVNGKYVVSSSKDTLKITEELVAKELAAASN